MQKYLSDKDIENFFEKENQALGPRFKCSNCKREVSLDAPGTKNRNHCPFCLYSLHVDDEVGDRKSSCQGLMKPIGKFYRPNNEEIIIHECIKCGKVSNNRVAGDDDFDLVERLPLKQVTNDE